MCFLLLLNALGEVWGRRGEITFIISSSCLIQHFLLSWIPLCSVCKLKESSALESSQSRARRGSGNGLGRSARCSLQREAFAFAFEERFDQRQENRKHSRNIRSLRSVPFHHNITTMKKQKQQSSNIYKRQLERTISAMKCFIDHYYNYLETRVPRIEEGIDQNENTSQRESVKGGLKLAAGFFILT